MKIIFGQTGLYKAGSASGVGLGNFDGLHIGHMALINTLISESRLSGLNSIVYTFTKHPENILRKKLFTPLITTVDKKVELLGQTPLNYLYFESFDERFSRMKPEQFVKEILVDKLKARLVVAGFNYRFGYRGLGNTDMLKVLARKYGFKVIVIPAIKIDNEVVSSTLIRQYIAKGKMDRVFELLGRQYSITGNVTSGRRIGNTLGFPTANILPEKYMILPDDGVYITKTLMDGELYYSITNIGNNPTFSGQKNISVETHILDFNGYLYGKNIEVFLISKLRGEKKFKSKDELVCQLQKDTVKAREFFETSGI